MMSFAQQWSNISDILYGEEYADELADLLQRFGVQTVLDCGCGDGKILSMLAARGYSGLGIDADPEMISLAERRKMPRISYKLMDWRNIDQLPGMYDAVICRGGSLLCGSSWRKPVADFDSEAARAMIEESCRKMLGKVHDDGLLYADAVHETEPRTFTLARGELQIAASIDYDRRNHVRYVHGEGTIGGINITGSSVSYLLSADELSSILTMQGARTWREHFQSETNYSIVCATK